jgi:tetratricopeptide (TPR) repeat protein
VSLLEFGLARVAFEGGQVDEAERLLRVSWETASASQVGWMAQICTPWLEARILRVRGRLEEARARLESAAGLADNGMFPKSMILEQLAHVMCDRGQPVAAVAFAEDAISGVGGHVLAHARALGALARALAESGRTTEAEARLREKLTLLERTDWDEEKVYALAQLASVLAKLGRADEASQAVESARTLLARFPAGADLGPLGDAIARA